MKNLRYSLIAFLASMVFASGLSAGTYSGGDGSSGNPYQITTTDDLIELSNTSDDWSSHFIQTTDIAFDTDESYVDWNNNEFSGPSEGFSPIGNSTTYFAGQFDGQGYTIDNLYINRNEYRQGLFGAVDSTGEIMNVNLINVEISGFGYVGGLVGQHSGSVSNCSSGGSVTSGGNKYIGGLVGFSNGTVDSSHSSGSVDGGSETGIGGLIGKNQGSVDNSYSTAIVTGGDSVGGFIGVNTDTITNSYSTGDVHGDYEVGGFVGSQSRKIRSSYSTGKVTSSGTNRIGGFVGISGGSEYDSFWDTNTSGMTNSDGGTGLTTAQMKDYNTFTDTTTSGLSTAWDFVTNPNDDSATDDYWDMDQAGTVNNGYPILRWQEGADDILVVPNAAPEISSEAVTSVDEDSEYSYALTASDANGDELTWSVKDGETLPDWLSLTTEGASDTTEFATGFTGQPRGVGYDESTGYTYLATYDSNSNYPIYKIDSSGNKTKFAELGAQNYGNMIVSGSTLYVSLINSDKAFL